MVVIFGLTWLPHNLASIILEYDEAGTFFHLWGQQELDISYLVNLFTHRYLEVVARFGKRGLVDDISAKIELEESGR